MRIEMDPRHAVLREIRRNITRLELELMDEHPRPEYLSSTASAITQAMIKAFGPIEKDCPTIRKAQSGRMVEIIKANNDMYRVTCRWPDGSECTNSYFSDEERAREFFLSII